jgi:hypothetical protein
MISIKFGATYELLIIEISAPIILLTNVPKPKRVMIFLLISLFYPIYIGWENDIPLFIIIAIILLVVGIFI